MCGGVCGVWATGPRLDAVLSSVALASLLQHADHAMPASGHPRDAMPCPRPSPI